MVQQSELHRKKRLDVIKSLISDSKLQDTRLHTFASILFSGISSTELTEISTHRLTNILCAAWKEFQSKKNFKLTIYAGHDEANDTSYTHIVILDSNKPFIVDSITSLLVNKGLNINLLLHPVFRVNRSEKGDLENFSIPEVKKIDTGTESIVCIELQEYLDKQEVKDLEDSIKKVLEDVGKSVEDWHKMRKKITDSLFELDSKNVVYKKYSNIEIQSFLQWLDRGYFTFLGYREYEADKKNNYALVESLGLLKGYKGCLFAQTIKDEKAILQGRMLKEIPVFDITKTLRNSTVHRTVPMDVIRVAKIDKAGTIIGERQFFGLFTSAVYNRSVRDIPLLRHKVKNILSKSGVAAEWHDGKALVHIMESFSRDELFQIEEEELLKTTQSIIQLQERQRVALYMRRDKLGHILSCLIYVPRDRYTSDLRQKFSLILEQNLDARTLSFHTEIGGDLAFARVNFILCPVSLNSSKDISLIDLEAELEAASMRWKDKFIRLVKKEYLRPKSKEIIEHYIDAFPLSYQESFGVENALTDIGFSEKALQQRCLQIQFYSLKNEKHPTFHLKLYNPGSAIILSSIMPILENMGLTIITESPYLMKVGELGNSVWMHCFKIRFKAECSSFVFEDIVDNFIHCLNKVWNTEIENDCFNALVVEVGLNWRQVNLIRAYYKYLKQIHFSFEKHFVKEAFSQNPKITLLIVQLFERLFDPKKKLMTKAAINHEVLGIKAALEKVLSSSYDHVFRSFLNLLLATTRTNYYCKDNSGEYKGYLSFKFDSQKITDLIRPRPAYEIYVYAPWMEAIHLRGGKIARGGIRWSDRSEDYRTEILGLVKAQMVKNSVIIPVGAKGGFIVKKNLDGLGYSDRLKEGIRCYKSMIRGLLDITDNLVKGKIIHPKDVQCLDDLDHYLVVAADKGTATFSDIANQVAAEYNFWMGDAFASGGSIGYDHKKMGITAKGAWVSVMRHFRELGLNTQTDPFSVIGVGDMSGDVFGNGMLLSKKIKLCAAFNHLHIFIDPNPDLENSYKERSRLFKLSRSSWIDYKKTAMSKGGMIIDRAAKKVKLSTQVSNLLKAPKKELTPNEIIKLILKAKADLLWFGGIGTFIKSETETHHEVGDRVNDPIRINASELECRVIGEGANLGLTQRARIEFSLNGGMINTDAIDNSAGVDTSDHEVNIKILLQDSKIDKTLSDKKRKVLLESMTDNVADLVLRNNYLQTQAVSMVHSRGYKVLGRQNRLMRSIEKMGKLDRDVEYLPDEKSLTSRTVSRTGLTRPEIAVLLAYGKIFAYEKIIDSDLPKNKLLKEFLYDYFPKTIKNKFKDSIDSHPLKDEIISTCLTNNLVNRVGPTFLNEMMDLTGAKLTEVVHAYLIIRESFNLESYWKLVEGMDYKVSAAMQMSMLIDIIELVEKNSLWLLRNNRSLDVGKGISIYAKGVQNLFKHHNGYLSSIALSDLNERQDKYKQNKVPADIAKTFSTLGVMNHAYLIIDLSVSTKKSIQKVSEIFHNVGERLGIDWLLKELKDQTSENAWTKRALYDLRDQLLEIKNRITKVILMEYDAFPAGEAIEKWLETNAYLANKAEEVLTKLRDNDQIDPTMLYVAVRQLTVLI
jgi:glutamate dehydrogenase